MRYQRARAGAASAFVELDAILSQAFRHLYRWQLRKSAERTDTPAFQRFENFRGRRKNAQRKMLQSRRFGSAVYNADAIETARRADSGIHICSNRDVGFDSTRPHLLGHLLGDL